MQQYIEYIYKHTQHGTSSKRGSKIDFSNPKFCQYFSLPPFCYNIHFHPHPTGLNPSFSSSLPTDGQLITLSKQIMYSNYTEKQRLVQCIYSLSHPCNGACPGLAFKRISYFASHLNFKPHPTSHQTYVAQSKHSFQWFHSGMRNFISCLYFNTLITII